MPRCYPHVGKRGTSEHYNFVWIEVQKICCFVLLTLGLESYQPTDCSKIQCDVKLCMYNA